MHDSTRNPSERIPLDDGHADVDVIAGSVEITVQLGDRALLGLALSADEADRLGEALRTAAQRSRVEQARDVDLEGARTLTDLVRIARDHGTVPSALMPHVRAGRDRA
jgi:hypothetical protein